MPWPPSCRGRPRSTRCSAGSRRSATSTSAYAPTRSPGAMSAPWAPRRAAQAHHRHGLQRGRARHLADPISRPRPARLHPPGLGVVGERSCSPADGDHPMTNHRPQQEAARHHPVGARRRAAQPGQQGRGPARDRPQRQAVRPHHRRRPRRRARPARRPHEPGRLPGRAARPGRRAGPGHGRATGRP